jgi:hypothetical protein
MSLPAVFGTGVQTYGDLMPFEGKTASGKPTIKWKQSPTLGEEILSSVTGKETSKIPIEQQKVLFEAKQLEDLKNVRNANLPQESEALFNMLKEMPPNVANQHIKSLKTTNPKHFNRIKKLFDMEQKGWTANDTFISNLSVKDGTRALIILKQANTYGSNERQQQYINDLRRKKILKPEVERHMNILLNRS